MNKYLILIVMWIISSSASIGLIIRNATLITDSIGLLCVVAGIIIFIKMMNDNEFKSVFKRVKTTE